MNDQMEEAYHIAKEWLKEINHCVEYENAWCFEDTDWIEFTQHLGERTGGCSGTCYVMQNDGRLIVSDLFDVEEIVIDTGNCAYIGVDAFSGCRNLTQIRISGDCVIDRDAFFGCTKVFIFSTAENVAARNYCEEYDNCFFVVEKAN